MREAPGDTPLAPDNPLRLRVVATLTGIRAALAEVVDTLPRLGMSGAGCASVELVLAEVMNNIAEHAYRGLSAGAIELVLWRCGDRLVCTVADSGLPMPGMRLPAGRPADLDCPTQDLPEGGFGWHMIRELTDELRYDRRCDRNYLTLVFRIA